MREVEKRDDGHLFDPELKILLTCPIKSSPEQGDVPCWHGCTWFRIQTNMREIGGEPVDGHDNFAFCQDHCIGRIKEADSGD